MIKCLIIDDEPLSRDVLRRFVNDHPELSLVGECKDAIETLGVLSSEEVDLLLLDINMPKLSGVNFYKSLQQKPEVIFVTAYPEFAVEGFELNAVDYLMKPVSFERFVQAIERVKVKLSSTPGADDSILLKVDKKIYRTPFSDILFCEALGDYVKVHLAQKTLIVTSTLKGLLESLPVDQFLRTHKSYIINRTKFDYVEGNQVIMQAHRVPIGQAYREDVFKTLKV